MQQFEKYLQAQVPTADNQLGTHAMGHKLAVVFLHKYPPFAGYPPLQLCGWEHKILFFIGKRTDSQQQVQYTQDNQVSRLEPENKLIKVVNSSGSVELNIDNGSPSVNDFQNLDPAVLCFY